MSCTDLDTDLFKICLARHRDVFHRLDDTIDALHLCVAILQLLPALAVCERATVAAPPRSVNAIDVLAEGAPPGRIHLEVQADCFRENERRQPDVPGEAPC